MESFGRPSAHPLRENALRLRLDGAPGAFLKDDGFVFTEAADRRRGSRGNPPLSSRPALRRAMKPRSGEPGRRSEGCLRRAWERSDRLDPQAAMRKAGQHGAPGNGAAKSSKD